MNYSRFVFLRKLSELSNSLQNAKVLYDSEIEVILCTYVQSMYSHGVIDSVVETLTNPEVFNSRATDLNDQWKSRREDWDVSAPQYAMGISGDYFIVLLYWPDNHLISRVEQMNKYLEKEN